MEITAGELFDLSQKKLWHGEYETTPEFRSIEKHAAVCFEDGGLIAVTGNVEDRESQLYAALFADAPAMLLEIVELRGTIRTLLDAVDYTEGACHPTEMVGACLPRVVIERCRQVLEKGNAK